MDAKERLLNEFGESMTPQEVANLLGVDVRTVKKYGGSLGGVRVAPGRWRFFENRIRRFIDANGDLTTWHNEVARGREDRRKDRRQQVVRERHERGAQGHTLGAGQARGVAGPADLAERAAAIGLGDFLPGGRATKVLHKDHVGEA
ncbi:MAG: helix-turn-helix domain-containing protein [Humidesulfovibrio sp.]|uniref:helix-turn-helix domain-containing protein n=1 Tax=Humidesulfovibrio sp. TaxID=2910988 RepID=UPI0027F60518|nr:helix-turn-helix domain-containing protein [Humidesulfovibrio sp.]MDQ7835784.1 helix-turn-helix domain-containing protein [Humidesulfovibrio sp.]